MPDQSPVAVAPSPSVETSDRPSGAPVAATAAAGEPVLVEADLLVEDVSIDGMCGVY